MWRWLAARYVTDVRRRGQVMAARRLVLGMLIVIVVMVNFSDEIGSAATVVGFAAAGIARRAAERDPVDRRLLLS